MKLMLGPDGIACLQKRGRVWYDTGFAGTVSGFASVLSTPMRSKKKAAIRFALMAAIKGARGKLDLRKREQPNPN
jgi:hypothetical protein